MGGDKPFGEDKRKFLLKVLGDVFPEVIEQGRVNIDVLKRFLGEENLTDCERYALNWSGKRNAAALASSHSSSTLVEREEYRVTHTPNAPSHILITGENLETLKVLLPEYEGRVRAIYIDPPYNKGKDFAYSDNFKKPLRDYLKATGQDSGDCAAEREISGRFHSEWLSMMYPRLTVARRFLREDGVIMVSIDDSEVHNLRLVMNEIFGEEHFVNMIHVKRASKNVNQQFQKLKRLNLGIEYVLVYRKTDSFYWEYPFKESSTKRKQGYWTSFYNNADRPTMRYELLGVTIDRGQWKWERERANRAVENYERFLKEHSFSSEKEELVLLKDYWLKMGRQQEFIKLKNGRPHYWVNPSEIQLRTTDWTDLYINDNQGKAKYGFDTAKSVNAVKSLVRAVSNRSDDVILDFFAGTGTTGEAVMQLNRQDGGGRQAVCIQWPEPLRKTGAGERCRDTIADICRLRLTECARKYEQGLQVFELHRLES